MGLFGGLSQGLDKLQDRKRQQRADQIDELTKYASLAESGYQIQPVGKNRLFGGQQMSLVQDPNFQGTKTLQRRKLELENQKLERQAANAERFGQGSSGGAFGGGMPDTESPFAPDPITGSPRTNPAYLDPLEKEKLAALQEKKRQASEADQNKNEMLRQDAESQLRAIQEAKKGKKYFGPMGNLPSIAAPSSLPVLGGQYGQRKEWENNVNKLLAGRVMELMTKLKQASKTGATGFGALNQKELALIQNASNVLSKDLPPDVAEKYLTELEGVYQRVLSGGGQRFGQPQQEQGAGLPEWVPQNFDYQSALRDYGSPEAVLEELRKAGRLNGN